MTLEEAIRKVVLDHFRMTLEDVTKVNESGRLMREDEQVLARHIMYYLYKESYKMPVSLKKVPTQLLGLNQDHTTVIHAIKNINSLIEWDKYYAPLIMKLKLEVDTLMMLNGAVSANEVANRIAKLQEEIYTLSQPFVNCANL